MKNDDKLDFYLDHIKVSLRELQGTESGLQNINFLNHFSYVCFSAEDQDATSEIFLTHVMHEIQLEMTNSVLTVAMET